MTTNYEVIDQFFAAQVACNESKATLKTLRPHVEAAVQALIKEQGLPPNFTGTIEYHGFKIGVSRPNRSRGRRTPTLPSPPTPTTLFNVSSI